ncbi:MAG: hypothetical protein M9944_07830 [Rhizobiaceae bacterium]|nr:hypothetical protein [Rhizobiaceae bacterium]
MSGLTENDAKSWHLKEAAHYNGGAAFFAYLHRCVEQPRLSRFDRYDRKTKSVTSTWKVDGADRLSLRDAIDALNTPPVFTAEELAFLRDAPNDFEPERRNGLDYKVADGVRNKGAIEFENGRFRITDLGRAAIKQGDAT